MPDLGEGERDHWLRIVAQLGDDEADRRADREAGGAERPAAADVAEVVDVEVDAGEADQRRERRSRRRRPAPPGPSPAAAGRRSSSPARRRAPSGRRGRWGRRSRGWRPGRSGGRGRSTAALISGKPIWISAIPASRTQNSVQRRRQASAAAQTAVSGQTKTPEPRKVKTFEKPVMKPQWRCFGDFDRGFVAGGRAGVFADHDDVGDRTKRATARTAISEVNSRPKVPPGVRRSPMKRSCGS